MDYEEKNRGSDWNEQQLFAQHFFVLEGRCRESQILMDYFGWKRNLLSKISLIMSVAKDKDSITLDELKKELQYFMGRINNLERKPSGYYCQTEQEMNEKKAQLMKLPNKDDLLFDVDSRVNKIANLYMPFLNIGKKYSITDL